ncbi:DNA primase [hydrothermal vent metagenome]|uniref:DNA primase n=1 Tax=hydrothermal vent metagenome TaxID=652676 RepID=A0A3B1D0N9_9ZZZZ
MSFIPEDVIAQVLDRCDIVDTVASYVALKPAGKNFKANCPFHNEKTPSFVVNPQRQIFHCFGCGVGGNVFSFIMKQDRLEFPEVVRMLAQKVHVAIPENNFSKSQSNNIRQQIFKVNMLAADFFHHHLLSDKSKSVDSVRQYLKGRGITLESVKRYHLGFALNQWDGLLEYLRGKDISLALMEKAGLIIAREGKKGYYDRFRNRIIFPIFDTREHCRAFGARSWEEEQGKVTAKYLNSPETPVYTKGHHLYGIHLSRNEIVRQDAAIIVEGYTDCLIPYQAGVKNVVASSGTALTVEQIRLLRRYTKNVYLLFDMDTAGEAAMLRSLDTLVAEDMNVKVVSLEEGEDPDSFIRQHGVDVFYQRLKGAKELFEYKLAILKQRCNVTSPEGKAEISSGMLGTLSKYSNAVVQAEYIKRLARDLNVSEQALITELKKLKTPEKTEKVFPRGPKNQNISVQKGRAVEFSILKLLLDDQNFVPATRKEILTSDFQDVRVRQVISKIYEWFDAGKDITTGNLINLFSDAEIQKIITELAADDEGMIGDKQKMHDDYLSRMKQDRLRIRIKKLQDDIQKAEYAGEQEQLGIFMKEYHQLLREKV